MYVEFTVVHIIMVKVKGVFVIAVPMLLSYFDELHLFLNAIEVAP